MMPLLRQLQAHAAKVALVAVLAIPALLTYKEASHESAENRRLAPLPAVPATWQAALAAPAQFDAWINDHLARRNSLVKHNTRLRYRLLGDFPTIQMAAGQQGRIFLAAHGTNVQPYSAMTSVCANGAPADAHLAAYLSGLFADFGRMGLAPKMMIVPSAPVVYSDEAPAWLQQRCASEATPAAKLLASPLLSAEARAAIWYPLAEMRTIRNNADLFPKAWFHWNGPGLNLVAEQSVSRLFGVPAAAAPALATQSRIDQSDVSFLFPGIDTSNKIVEPDLAAANIDACYGPACFPELAGFSATLGDLSRFRNPHAPRRRLLIVSDSFGAKISGWYARYYGTVEHVATNAVGQLSSTQMAQLSAFLFRDRADTDVLFLYHDAGLTGTIEGGLRRFHASQTAAN
jgi:hypothetical protein